MSAALAVALLGGAGVSALPQGPAAPAPAPQTPAAVPRPPTKSKPTGNWPDAQAMAKQKRDVEKLKLFNDAAPVEFTLTADFKAVNKDRNPTSTKMFPATIQVTKSKGAQVSFDLQIRTRGHVRRNFQTCEFAPLRLEFPKDKDKTKGTIFEDQTALKLGTHCRSNALFEQYVLREYAAYRLFNLVTPRSFRARLARVTYVDAATSKPLGTKYGMFIEDDDDVAKRLEGRLTEQRVALARIDRDALTLMTLVEYLIGNTDLSVSQQHNVRLVQTPGGPVYTVPYDFDYSGLVDAVYAIPAKGLGITSVRERLYRGPYSRTSRARFPRSWPGWLLASDPCRPGPPAWRDRSPGS